MIVVIVGITLGKIKLRGAVIRNGIVREDEQSEGYGPEEQAALADRLLDVHLDLARLGDVAHFVGSSDMDFAEECGWPSADAGPFFQAALDDASRRFGFVRSLPLKWDRHVKASRQSGRDSSCGKKIDYRSEATADGAANSMNKKKLAKGDPKLLETYPCTFCCGWHVGR